MNRDKEPLSGLKKIDVFGKSVQLFIDDSTTHKTRAGGFITLIIITVLLIQLIPTYISLVQRKDVIIQTQTGNMLKPALLNLTNGKFMFALKAEDSSILFNSYLFTYSVQLTMTTQVGNTINTNKTKILFRPCNISDFPGYEDQYQSIGLDSAMCPIWTQMQLQGAFGGKIFQYMKLAVSGCTNNTNIGITCAPQSNITTYFQVNQKIRVSLYFINQEFDPLNYDVPLKGFIDSQNWILSTLGTLVRTTDLYFQQTLVSSSSNVLSTLESTNETRVQYNGLRADDSFVPNNANNDYLNVFLRSSYVKTAYIRRYQTISDILSYIGGIWNLLYLVLGFAAGYFNDMLYRADLANILYDFDAKDCDKESEEQKTKTMDREFKLFQKTMKIKDDDDKSISKSKTVFHKFWKIKEKRSILVYHVIDFFKGLFNCYKDSKPAIKNKMLQKASEKIAQDLDIRLILKRLQEVKKIKKIVLDKNERKIIKFIPPPIIRLDQINHKLNKQQGVDEKNTKRYETNTDSENNKFSSPKSTTPLNLFPLQANNVDMIEDFCRNLCNYGRYSGEYVEIQRSTRETSVSLMNTLEPEIKRIFEYLAKINSENSSDVSEREIVPSSEEKFKIKEEILSSLHIQISNENDCDEDNIYELREFNTPKKICGKENDNQNL